MNSIFTFLNQFAEIIPAPFYWLDTNLIMCGCNSIAIDAINIIGKTNFVGKTAFEVYLHSAETAIKLTKDYKKVLKTGKLIKGEDILYDPKSGTQKYFMATKAPLRNEQNEIIGIVGTSIDITSEKLLATMQAEEQQRKVIENKQKEFRSCADQLVYGIQYYTLKLLKQRLDLDIKKTELNEFTSKQYKILGLLAQGKSPKQIAKELFNSTEDTVIMTIVSVVNNLLARMGTIWEDQNLIQDELKTI